MTTKIIRMPRWRKGFSGNPVEDGALTYTPASEAGGLTYSGGVLRVPRIKKGKPLGVIRCGRFQVQLQCDWEDLGALPGSGGDYIWAMGYWADRVLAADAVGRIYDVRNFGDSISYVSTLPDQYPSEKIHGIGSGHWYALTGTPGKNLFHSNDDGNSWADMNAPSDVRCFAFYSNGVLLAGGSNGEIWDVSGYIGSSYVFNHVADLPGLVLFVVNIGDPDSFVAYGLNSTSDGYSFYRTTNRGVGWSEISAIPDYVQCLTFCADSSTLLAGTGTEARVYVSTDFGDSWAASPEFLPALSSNKYVQDIICLGGGNAMASTNINEWAIKTTNMFASVDGSAIEGSPGSSYSLIKWGVEDIVLIALKNHLFRRVL